MDMYDKTPDLLLEYVDSPIASGARRSILPLAHLSGSLVSLYVGYCSTQ